MVVEDPQRSVTLPHPVSYRELYDGKQASNSLPWLFSFTTLVAKTR